MYVLSSSCIDIDESFEIPDGFHDFRHFYLYYMNAFVFPSLDIDECLFSPSVCGPDSNCTNEIGSYNCSCLDGFTATNSSLSININNRCRGTFCV